MSARDNFNRKLLIHIQGDRMILIGADFVPTAGNVGLFCDGDCHALVGEELEALLAQADFRIFNLETPLCDNTSPILKNGTNFSAPAACVKGYAAAGVDLLTLANNHILDQGVQGLTSTWNILKRDGIDTVGTGENVYDAAKPYLFDCYGKKIGVYACTEHEFSIAGGDCAGANPFDPLESPDHIAALKAACDFVIVLYHGGKEYYRYPSPLLQKTCRKLIDKGADVVLCQHSHCIGCEERWGGGVIVYGQGNFLFDNSSREEWQTSLLVGIDEDLSIRYYPLMKSGSGVRLAPPEKAQEIMTAFERRGEEILEQGFIQKNYAAFARDTIDMYLTKFGGRRSLLYRAFNKLTGYRLNRLVIRRYDKTQTVCLQNYFDCEAHRELITEGLRQKAEES